MTYEIYEGSEAMHRRGFRRITGHIVGPVSLGLALQLGAAGWADGQGRQAPVPPAAAPVVTAGFPVPTTALDHWHTAPWLRTCQEVFENAVVAHPNVPVTGAAGQVVDANFSLPAIAAGRRCLQQIGGGDTLAPYDWNFLLRFAVALNDDSLAQRVVTRQLGVAGPSAGARAAVYTNVVDQLLNDRWMDVDTGNSNSAPLHRTAVHVALARRYVTELDTVHPPGEVLMARLRLFDVLVQLDTSAWNPDSDVVRWQYRQRLLQSVPRKDIPPVDSLGYETYKQDVPMRLAWAEYVRTPAHENLTIFRAAFDALYPPETVDSLVGHPAPRLTGDYWFDSLGHTAPPVVPAPGTVSLLLFLAPHRVVQQEKNDDGRRDLDRLSAQLSALHTQNPKLQIVLVAMTEEVTQPPGKPDDPDKDASFIADLYTKKLGLPGTLCVLRSRYHTEPGETAVPLASPVLNAYHLDPRMYNGTVLLVDATGWVVAKQWVMDGHLIQRLLAR